MPAGYDAEVADLFRDLRAASGMSETALAAELATRLEVVQALEQGAIYALPPWPETCRVISTYGTLLNLDVRPLLRRIYAQIEAGIVELAPKPMPDVPFMAPPQDGMRDGQAQQRPAAPPPRVSEPFPAQPRQASPQPLGPQAMPNRQPPPQGGQAAQSRQPAQSYPQGAPPRGVAPPPPRPQPQAQQRPQPAPEMRPQPKPPQAPPRALPQPQARQAAPAPARPKPAAMSAPAAKPARKGGKGFLKWGVVALLASGVAFGLWMWMSQPSLFGSSSPAVQSGKEGSTPAANADPNDPRSRKADRLPSPPS